MWKWFWKYLRNSSQFWFDTIRYRWKCKRSKFAVDHFYSRFFWWFDCLVHPLCIPNDSNDGFIFYQTIQNKIWGIKESCFLFSFNYFNLCCVRSFSCSHFWSDNFKWYGNQSMVKYFLLCIICRILQFHFLVLSKLRFLRLG